MADFLNLDLRMELNDAIRKLHTAELVIIIKMASIKGTMALSQIVQELIYFMLSVIGQRQLQLFCGHLL